MKKSFYKSVIIMFILLLPVVLLLSTRTSSIGAYAEDEDDRVYLGGFPIGIEAKSEYLIVEDFRNVTTMDGSFSPALKAGVQKGDAIVTVNGAKVTDIKTFQEKISSSNQVLLSVKRGKMLIDIPIQPVFDRMENAYKIGISVRNDLVGMGTMTFTTKEGRFGALGHYISDEFGNVSYYQKGNIYESYVTGYRFADRNVPGELRGKVYFDKSIGSIEKNAFCGIFGKYSGNNNRERIQIGHREDVHPGEAKMLTTIEGTDPKWYDIEIIKAEKQQNPAEKSMVIRVKDRTLRAMTGGILQGMSGSPIVQDGKLIGAVTHVFNADSTKGYGVYIDWMMDKVS